MSLEELPRKDYIPELDGLRGLLSLWVFGYHIPTIAGVWDRLPSPAQRFLDGAQAVDVFIVLSGFVITNLLLRSRQTYLAFIIRRFFRLWPVFAVCIAGALCVQALGWMPVRGEPLLPHLVAHLTMLHGAVPDYILPGSGSAILNPAWSISLEWQFYLIAPLFIRRDVPALIQAAIVSGLAFCLYRVVNPMLAGYGAGFLPTKMHLFWVGIICAMAYPWLTRPGNRTVGTPLVLGGLAAALMFLPFAANFGLLIWLAVFSALVAGQPASLLAGLRAGPAERLGKITYPLYLSHEVVLWPVLALGTSLGLTGWPLAGFMAAIAAPIVLAASLALHTYIERPAIETGRRVTRRPTAVPV